jgi:LysR family carnitine catabolism transcriptional activator
MSQSIRLVDKSMKPDLRLLTTFLKIAEAGGFSAAGRLHGLSQPTLSRHIQQLEQALGQRVFDRDTRNLSLTPVGQELLTVSSRLLEDFRRSFARLSEFVNGEKGRVVVMAVPTLAATIVPSAMARFAKTHPGVEVELREGFTQSILEAIPDNTAEIGMTIRPPPANEITFTPLMRDRFLAVGNDELKGFTGSLTWGELAQRPFIAFDRKSSIRIMTDEAFAKANAIVNARYECKELATIGALIAAGLGVTALPQLAVSYTFAAARTVPLVRPEVTRTLGILTSSRRSLSPAAQDFAACLTKQALLSQYSWTQASPHAPKVR